MPEVYGECQVHIVGMGCKIDTSDHLVPRGRGCTNARE